MLHLHKKYFKVIRFNNKISSVGQHEVHVGNACMRVRNSESYCNKFIIVLVESPSTREFTVAIRHLRDSKNHDKLKLISSSRKHVKF